MNIYTVTLTEDERKVLYELTLKGKRDSQQILNALILLIVIKVNGMLTIQPMKRSHVS